MKVLTSILLIFIISVRSFLPLLDYVINYDYISTQLCENRDKPELLCNGKCYVKKEFTQNQSTKNQQCEVKIQIVDVFVPQENLNFEINKTESFVEKQITFHHCKFTIQRYYKEFFHPSLV